MSEEEKREFRSSPVGTPRYYELREKIALEARAEEEKRTVEAQAKLEEGKRMLQDLPSGAAVRETSGGIVLVQRRGELVPESSPEAILSKIPSGSVVKKVKTSLIEQAISGREEEIRIIAERSKAVRGRFFEAEKYGEFRLVPEDEAPVGGVVRRAPVKPQHPSRVDIISALSAGVSIERARYVTARGEPVWVRERAKLVKSAGEPIIGKELDNALRKLDSEKRKLFIEPRLKKKVKPVQIPGSGYYVSDEGLVVDVDGFELGKPRALKVDSKVPELSYDRAVRGVQIASEETLKQVIKDPLSVPAAALKVAKSREGKIFIGSAALSAAGIGVAGAAARGVPFAVKAVQLSGGIGGVLSIAFGIHTAVEVAKTKNYKELGVVLAGTGKDVLVAAAGSAAARGVFGLTGQLPEQILARRYKKEPLIVRDRLVIEEVPRRVRGVTPVTVSQGRLTAVTSEGGLVTAKIKSLSLDKAITKISVKSELKDLYTRDFSVVKKTYPKDLTFTLVKDVKYKSFDPITGKKIVTKLPSRVMVGEPSKIKLPSRRDAIILDPSGAFGEQFRPLYMGEKGVPYRGESGRVPRSGEALFATQPLQLTKTVKGTKIYGGDFVGFTMQDKPVRREVDVFVETSRKYFASKKIPFDVITPKSVFKGSLIGEVARSEFKSGKQQVNIFKTKSVTVSDDRRIYAIGEAIVPVSKPTLPSSRILTPAKITKTPLSKTFGDGIKLVQEQKLQEQKNIIKTAAGVASSVIQEAPATKYKASLTVPVLKKEQQRQEQVQKQFQQSKMSYQQDYFAQIQKQANLQSSWLKSSQLQPQKKGVLDFQDQVLPTKVRLIEKALPTPDLKMKRVLYLDTIQKRGQDYFRQQSSRVLEQQKTKQKTIMNLVTIPVTVPTQKTLYSPVRSPVSFPSKKVTPPKLSDFIGELIPSKPRRRKAKVKGETRIRGVLSPSDALKFLVGETKTIKRKSN